MMTVSEFKAWLEGFETALGGNPPSAEQWAAIKSKLAKVSDAPKAAYRGALPIGWNDKVMFNDNELKPLTARY